MATITRRGLRGSLAALLLASCGGGAASETPIALPPAMPAPAPSPNAESPRTDGATALPDLPIRELSEPERAKLETLLSELRAADKPGREELLDRLERELGGRGLIAALSVADPSKNEAEESADWFRTRQIFDRLDTLADPSCADDLYAWWERSKHEHWKGRAAALLARLGDMRGARGLARRLRFEPGEIYERDSFWQADAGGHLSRTDRPRIVAARLLADLAVLHPTRRKQLRQTAERAVLTWMLGRPTPHANAMRFLALAGSGDGARHLARWAAPAERLPDVGAQPPFPREFELAQSALRYYGATGRDAAFAVLKNQLLRKPHDEDISQEALMGAGMAMRGMALRALAYGAAQGFAELGDERAHEPLARIVADPRHHEEAREVACLAVVWCTPTSERRQMARALRGNAASNDPGSVQQATCLAAALASRPTPGIGDALISALEAAQVDDLRVEIAGALVSSGAEPVEDRLIALLGRDETRATAAAALMLGGSPAGARHAAKAAAKDPKAQDALFFVANAIGTTDEHLESGTFDRWAENFRAYREESPWPIASLQGFFDNVLYDTGPHSMTRVVMRRRLIHRALHGNDAERENARTLLQLMREEGVLRYLDRHAVRGDAADEERPPRGD